MNWYGAVSAPQEVRAAGRQYEARFGIKFARYCHFDEQSLRSLHRFDGGTLTSLTVVSESRPQIADWIAAMTRVANLSSPTTDDRRAYLAALLSVFDEFPTSNRAIATSPLTYCVAPRREGHRLAVLTGALPEGRSLAPNVKRIPFRKGLLVGITDVTPPADAEPLLVIDGAVATAGTLLAVLAAFGTTATTIRIHAVHATDASVRALASYAHEDDRPIEVIIGHVSGSLDDHFYARDVEDQRRLVIGDIGDIIAPLFE